MITSVREFLNLRYGISTGSRETAAAAVAGVTAAQLLPQDSRRLAFTYFNLSAGDTHYLRPMYAPTATRGIQVGPGGGNVSFNCLEDGEFVAYEWLVLSTGAASAYYCLETLIEVTEMVK